MRLQAHVAHFQQGLVCGHVLVLIHGPQRAPHHHVDDGIHLKILLFQSADVLAVAQYAQPVAHALEFFQAVGDIDDGYALRAQTVDEGKEDVDLILGQRGCRLIHNDDAAVAGEHFGNFNDLLLRCGELLHQHIGINVNAHFLQEAFGFGAHGLLVLYAAARNFAAHENVVRHGQVAAQV